MENRMLLFLICLLLVSAGCKKDEGIFCKKGKGTVQKREIYLDSFNSIDLEGSGSVFIKQGTPQKVEVETNENLFKDLNQHISGKEWKIKFHRCICRYDKLNIYISVPDLESIKISGSGIVNTTDTIVTNNLSLHIAGSGNIYAQARCTSVSSDISGSGNINLVGTAKTFSSHTSGSGDIEASDLSVSTAVVDINGSGKTKINVQNDLTVNISGSGDVYYKGHPEINSKTSGSGRVQSIN